MSKQTYLGLTKAERMLLEEALAEVVALKRPNSGEMSRLLTRIRRTEGPKITVAVEGGMVQWASGNPFPIRICDYDTDGVHPKNKDELGRPCVISFVPEDEFANRSRYTAHE